jgi:hypothetical protein
MLLHSFGDLGQFGCQARHVVEGLHVINGTAVRGVSPL